VQDTGFVLSAMGMLIRRKLSSEPQYPYMVAKEIFIIEQIIKRHKPGNCLEWGSGYSTLFFSRFLTKEAKWYSIEHDKKWYEEIRPKISVLKNVELALVEPDHQPWTDKQGDGSYDDMRSYILYPKEKLLAGGEGMEAGKGGPLAKGKFDFILVDGRARKHCLEQAGGLLSEKGILVLHDANRKHYLEGRTKKWEHEHLFTDERTDAGGLLIASNSDIGPELERFRMVWSASERWERRKGFRMAFK